jgi:hypothetical protein
VGSLVDGLDYVPYTSQFLARRSFLLDTDGWMGEMADWIKHITDMCSDVCTGMAGGKRTCAVEAHKLSP